MSDKPHVEIYTDGCALGNPGKGGAGAVLTCKSYSKELSIHIEDTTNNRAELLAIIYALEALNMPCRVDIYSDSQITVRCASGGYQRKKNTDLWMRYNAASIGHQITLHWIRKDSHDLNHKAHELANKAARTA
ncbi:MAG: RNase H family protein [Chloroflexota bacterium]